MTATYLRHGRGESLNSLSAKSDGIYPKTTFKKTYGISLKVWKLIEAIHTPSEWHHTGKYANKTYFYNPEEVKLAWIDNYSYESLPLGLKGIETFQIKYFKERLRQFKNGGHIWNGPCTQISNKHRTIQQGFTRLLYQGKFTEAGKLLNRLPKGSCVETEIATGLLSLQTATKFGNLNSKERFYPHTFLGFTYFN